MDTILALDYAVVQTVVFFFAIVIVLTNIIIDLACAFLDPRGLPIQITDAFMSLTFLMVAVTVVSLLGPSKTNVILVLGLLRWMSYARVLRSEVLPVTETDYVRLAKVAGASNWRIILRHVMPNLSNTLLIISTLELGTVIIFESAPASWGWEFLALCLLGEQCLPTLRAISIIGGGFR